MINEKSMKPLLWALAAGAVAAGCSAPNGNGDEQVATATQALNGVLNPLGNLTRKSKQGGALLSSDEGARQSNTHLDYYQFAALLGFANLDDFRETYFLPNLAETVAYYYNRGDLGIGREMHCVDGVGSTWPPVGQIACYVRNFAAGDDGSEFTFGLSPQIAFRNMDSNHPFATVAMVFDPDRISDRVKYMVFSADGSKLLYAAALDRVGITFNQAFNALNGNNNPSPQNPDPSFGTPGVHFNNHIPTNCMSCHGGHGSYNNVGGLNGLVQGSTFLPFDLDSFEYPNTPGKTRADQEANFKTLNALVRKVAGYGYTDQLPSRGYVGNAVRKEIDNWYGNTNFQNSTLDGLTFDGSHVPGTIGSNDGWRNNAAAEAVYTKVVSKFCRNCHAAMDFVPTSATATPTLVFDTEAQFQTAFSTFGARAALCNATMPHSLQTLRQFWQSNAPVALEAWIRGAVSAAEADAFHNCSPGAKVTLDPPALMAALGG